MSALRVGVVGGGLGGLAAAALLARAGHEVTVFEASSRLGGKCRRILVDGQAIDTGPSLLTFPGVLRELFRRWDALADGGPSAERVADLHLRRLPRLATHVFEDAEVPLPVPPDHPMHGAWRAYARAHEQLGPTLERLLHLDPRALATHWPAVRLAWRYRGRSSVASYLRSRRLPEALRRAIGIHAFDSGVGPGRALPLFASLPAVLASDGAYTPAGGMYELVKALARLARAAGAELVPRAPVGSIDTQTLRVGRTRWRFDRIVANVDPHRLARLLGDPPPAERPSTCSGVAIYGTVRGRLPARLNGHVVLMPPDDDALEAALEARREPDGTMVMLRGRPARAGRRATLAVLLTAPANGRRYGLEDPFVRRELARARAWLGLREPVEALLREPVVLDPAYFGEGGAPGGALYGDVRGVLRSGPLHDFPHRDPARPWLFRVGASVHPGGGIPAVLGGAMIAVARLLAEVPSPRAARRANFARVSP